MAEAFGRSFGQTIAEKFAAKLMDRLEDEGALPLPERMYDVVVDDPDMATAHVYRRVLAISPRAAAVEGYKRAMRDEGFRPGAQFKPGGDEQVLALAREGCMWAIVHHSGRHPQINYETSEFISPASVKAAE